MKNKKPTVLVAMSGGVDSSVSAALLKKQGYEATGVTFKLFCYAKNKTQEKACCSLEAIELARQVCQKLDIPHYVLDVSKKFKKEIIQDFINEYVAGRTPNPCVRCNQMIKFPALISYAQKLGIDLVATGHYARVKRGMKYKLLKAKDDKKDQTYFLWTLNQSQLKHILFPIGDYKKPEVRKMAKKFGLPTAERPESQEICFIENDYRDFLGQKAKKYIKEGPIFDLSGRKLGLHKGLVFYTIGQRTGLGISAYNPLYVIKIDAKNNTLIVGEDRELFGKELVAQKVNFISQELSQKPILAGVKIRYGMDVEKATVQLVKDEKTKVIFEKSQRAITPGQSVVFYKGNEVLGGGIISS